MRKQGEQSAREGKRSLCSFLEILLHFLTVYLIRTFQSFQFKSSSVTSNALNRAHVLADPTSFEEPLLDTSINVIVDEHGQISSVVQDGIGAGGIGADLIGRCIGAARARRRELTEVLDVSYS